MPQTKIFVVAGICLVLLFATGGLLYSKTWNPQWNPFAPSPEEIVSQALAKMWELQAVKIESTFSINLSGEEPFSFLAKLAFGQDKIDLQKSKFISSFNITATKDKDEFSLAGETKTNGEDTYFKITQFPKFLEERSLLSYLGIDITKIKNNWIKYNKKSFAEIMVGEGIEPSTSSQDNDNIFKLPKEPYEKSIQFIKSGKFYIIKDKLPAEKINGQTTYHYAVALNAPEVKNFIIELTSLPISSSSISSAMSPLAFLPLSFTSFPSAVGKAKEARVISAMAQLRTVALMEDVNYGSYGNFSCATQDASLLCEEISKQVGQKPVIFTNQNGYCSFTPLTVEGYYYCIDSTGKASQTLNPQVAGYCDGKTFICPPETQITKEDREKADRKQLVASLDSFFNRLGEVTADVWIGQRDGFIYKIKFNKDFLPKENDQNTKLTFAIESIFSDFDKSIDIQEPSEFKTLAEAFAPPPPKIAYPINNSETHSIAPSILIDTQSSSASLYFVAIWQGKKEAISKDSKDFLTWSTVDYFGDSKIGGPVGKLSWNQDYTVAAKTCRDKDFNICSEWSEPLHFTIKPGVGAYTETDKGKNYNVAGMVIFSKEAGETKINGQTVKDVGAMKDVCLYDFTDKPEDRGVLLEYYKTGNAKNPVQLEQYRCPDSCEEGACIKSSIKIVSPASGDKLFFGSSEFVEWQSKGVDKVNIFITAYDSSMRPVPFEGSLNGYSIASDVDAKSGYKFWNISKDIEYFSKYPCYKIKVETLDKRLQALSPTCLKIEKLN